MTHISDYSEIKVESRIKTYNRFHIVRDYIRIDHTCGITEIQFRPGLSPLGQIVGSLGITNQILNCWGMEIHLFDSVTGEKIGTNKFEVAKHCLSEGYDNEGRCNYAEAYTWFYKAFEICGDAIYMIGIKNKMDGTKLAIEGKRLLLQNEFELASDRLLEAHALLTTASIYNCWRIAVLAFSGVQSVQKDNVDVALTYFQKACNIAEDFEYDMLFNMVLNYCEAVQYYKEAKHLVHVGDTKKAKLKIEVALEVLEISGIYDTLLAFHTEVLNMDD